jgi:signal peptidase II
MRRVFSMAALLYYWLPSVFCGLLVLLDQSVKRWAAEALRPIGEKPFLPGFVRLSYVENRGAAFGIMQGAGWFFIPLTVVMLIVIAWYYARLPKARRYWLARVPMLMLLAGAAGNFIDRVRHGYVVDMFEFEFISFPVFNVADICLVAGAAASAFVLLFVVKE